MKYTIIDTKRGNTRMIQNDFDKIEEAQAKLKILKAKVSDRHEPTIVGVDAEGNFHSLEKAADKPKPPGK